MSRLRLAGMAAVLCGLLIAPVEQADAAITIGGTVGDKYLVTGMPVTVGSASAVFKISFENQTAGTNLALCVGSTADFAAKQCPLRLSDSGGPGFVFLTIVDSSQLAGKVMYVLRMVGSGNSKFSLTIE
jgi:hypothetical protein